MKERICPRCGKKYTGYPALSRRDNKTEICPDCGVAEAFEDFFGYKEIVYKGWSIADNFYSKGEFTIHYYGDDLVFTSLGAAYSFIDEIEAEEEE